jgi:hypothetical protein
LRAAAACGIAIGGWCPPGRRCEDGTIPDEFPLSETPAESSPDAADLPRSQRTEWNVRDADATLILSAGVAEVADRGTRWTAECASRLRKPLLRVDPGDPDALTRAREWLTRHPAKVLNVAGPSERNSPGIGAVAERFVRCLLGSP